MQDKFVSVHADYSIAAPQQSVVAVITSLSSLCAKHFQQETYLVFRQVTEITIVQSLTLTKQNNHRPHWRRYPPWWTHRCLRNSNLCFLPALIIPLYTVYCKIDKLLTLIHLHTTTDTGFCTFSWKYIYIFFVNLWHIEYVVYFFLKVSWNTHVRCLFTHFTWATFCLCRVDI